MISSLLFLSAYIGHPGIGNGAADLDEDKGPAFQVTKRLNKLVTLEFIILDASHILLDSQNGLVSVIFPEKPGVHRGVWKPVEKNKCPDNSDSAKNEKHGLRKVRT